MGVALTVLLLGFSHKTWINSRGGGQSGACSGSPAAAPQSRESIKTIAARARIISSLCKLPYRANRIVFSTAGINRTGPNRPDSCSGTSRHGFRGVPEPVMFVRQ